MDLVQVQIIGSQPLKRAVYLPKDSLFGQAAVIEEHLGSNNHLVAGDAGVPQCPAQVLLAGAERIDISGVEEIDAQVDGVLYHSLRVFRAQCPLMELFRSLSVGHTAYADAGDFNPGVAKGSVFHIVVCFSLQSYRITSE